MSTATSSDQPCQKNLRQPAQHAAVENQLHYERHRPEETTLYRLVQEHVEAFFAQVETETGSGLPSFVKDEFEAFLECGILAHGFLRLRCANCAHENWWRSLVSDGDFVPRTVDAEWRRRLLT